MEDEIIKTITRVIWRLPNVRSVIQRGCQLPRLASAIVNEYEHEALV